MESNLELSEVEHCAMANEDSDERARKEKTGANMTWLKYIVFGSLFMKLLWSETIFVQ